MNAFDFLTGDPDADRLIIRAATRGWSQRQIEGERPRPIPTTKPLKGVCAWCFEPVGSKASSFNGGRGHPECARHAYEAVAGDGAAPWPIPEPTEHEHDPITPFLRRLASEAKRHGLNRQAFLRAIDRALRDA